MNTADLESLAERADGVRGHESGRLQEVHDRIRVARLRRRAAGALSGVALIVVVVVAANTLRLGEGRMAPAQDPAAGPTIPAPELAIMRGAPAELPAWVSQRAGLPVKDLAQVADVEHLEVFASRDGQDNWCVVLAIEPTSKGSDWATGSSCAPPDRFATHGVRVEATASSGRHGGALLLPDDYRGDIGADWERVNDNVALRR